MLQRELDFERTRLHRLVAHARDSGGHPTTAEVPVLVHVLDSNDNQPLIAFDITGGGAGAGAGAGAEAGEAVVRVLEGPDSRDRLLAIVSVSDSDSGPNGQFSCTLDSVPAAGSLFQLVPFQSSSAGGPAYYQLKVAPDVELDREAPSVRDGVLQVAVTCEDHGVPHRLNAQRILAVGFELLLRSVISSSSLR